MNMLIQTLSLQIFNYRHESNDHSYSVRRRIYRDALRRGNTRKTAVVSVSRSPRCLGTFPAAFAQVVLCAPPELRQRASYAWWGGRWHKNGDHQLRSKHAQHNARLLKCNIFVCHSYGVFAQRATSFQIIAFGWHQPTFLLAFWREARGASERERGRSESGVWLGNATA